MKRIRLYVEHFFHHNLEISLNKDQSHYLSKVMRLRIGEVVSIFNGRQGEWIAEVTNFKNKIVDIRLQSQIIEQQETSDIWLLFAPIKNTRFSFIIEKGTELGVTKFIPVDTQHTLVKEVKTDKLLLTAIEAAEQCERLSIPTIDNLIPLKKLLEQWPVDRKIIFCDERKNANSIINECKNLQPNVKLAILVGPEGGFSNAESGLLNQMHFVISVHLGPRILRAETASLAAISCIQASIGDWQ